MKQARKKVSRVTVKGVDGSDCYFVDTLYEPPGGKQEMWSAFIVWSRPEEGEKRKRNGLGPQATFRMLPPELSRNIQ